MECVGRRGRSGRELTANPYLDRLARALGAHDATLAERDPPVREAAVALALLAEGDDASLLMVRRATHAADPWSGQVALPGGRSELCDESLLHTAIRETFEETALDLTDATLLGTLDEIRTRSVLLPPVIVRPYVFVITQAPVLAPSIEIAEVFWARLGVLFSADCMLRTQVDARGMQLTVDAIDFEGRIIWGMTERILRSLQRVVAAYE
jgi:8-oxo-dGTP pyrophosphatase MutT (NUDIX family)